MRTLPITALLCLAQTVVAQDKMSFEVASVKLDTSGVFKPPSFPLSIDDSFTDTGGRFTADFQLSAYIQFAYKLWLIPEQVEAMLSHQPAWLNNERYLIEAKAPIAHPNKDQMRLMMQSLLADRFHFVAHFETHQGRILAMTLAKPGKTGPNLSPHDQGPPCDTAPPATTYPPKCDVYSVAMQPDKPSLLGSRNTTTELLAHSLPLVGHLGRPVVDRTGLTGRYDFKMNFVMSAPIGPGSGDAPLIPDIPGPTFLEAVRDQPGLKLEPTEGPIQVLVIDHIEKPTEN
ncbi:MAG TPA: TIGR03435 family protein [Bryobacteraceae bacterium]|jgi:uncharacterized protein (TIGR03435 family)